MITIEEFCEKHDACKVGMKWALENCKSMADVWENLRPEWLIWVATREGVLTEKELRLFAVDCARQVQHLMTDQRSIAAIDVADRHAHGSATDAELDAAALAAARDAAWAAARDAAWAARAAAWAALDAARDAARDAQAAALDAQASYLRANCKPRFD